MSVLPMASLSSEELFASLLLVEIIASIRWDDECSNFGLFRIISDSSIGTSSLSVCNSLPGYRGHMTPLASLVPPIDHEGWSGHPVCRKRFHFIIPAEKNNATGNPVLQQLELGDGTPKACTVCGNMLHLLDLRCETCNFVTAEDNNEDWLYPQLEDSTHLLHGVVHSNGYGHLITLNGREGGSKIISGCDILNFWDRLCQTLAVRKISVMDVSKKYGMEYRLLHAITYGHSWYGNWGYEFGTGSYGTKLSAYQNAVTSLSTIPLSLFTFHSRGPATRLQELIGFYQSISDSKLVTLQDLFSFVLLLIQKRRGGSTNLRI